MDMTVKMKIDNIITSSIFFNPRNPHHSSAKSLVTKSSSTHSDIWKSIILISKLQWNIL